MIITPRKTAGYGWRPSLPHLSNSLRQYRDIHHSMALGIVVHPDLPTNTTGANKAGAVGGISLRHAPTMPPIFDQTTLGSCTANGWLRLKRFVVGGSEDFSRLDLYYRERERDGTIYSDSGAQIADGAWVLENIGVGLEKDWPYDVSKFATAPPPVECSEEPSRKDPTCSQLRTYDDFMDCLKQGYPFVTGISVYPGFESAETAQTGIIPMPTLEESCIGGHCVCVVGGGAVINGVRYFEGANSWGEGWGDDGYFWIPEDYLTNPYLSQDAWTMRP